MALYRFPNREQAVAHLTANKYWLYNHEGLWKNTDNNSVAVIMVWGEDTIVAFKKETSEWRVQVSLNVH